MGQVVNMLDVIKKQKPPQDEPCMNRNAKCMLCQKTWVAARAPVGTVWLVCPFCGCNRGYFVYPCEYKESEEWVCDCGNKLFRVYLEGVFCPNCGIWQYGF